MSTSSKAIRVQKARDAPSSRSRPMSRLRYHAPNTPSAMSATIFTHRIAPYGDSSASQFCSPIAARTVPDAATTTKAASAMLE
jgi:hypothetical protein